MSKIKFINKYNIFIERLGISFGTIAIALSFKLDQPKERVKWSSRDVVCTVCSLDSLEWARFLN